MRLVTCQDYSVYEKILRDGYHACNIQDSKAPEIYVSHYYYIVKVLSKKVAKPEGVSYPIWAYYKTPADYDEYMQGEAGETLVFMELEVPDEEVLLIDPIKWDTLVFNEAVFSLDLDYDEQERIAEYFANEADAEEREANWRQIFEIDNMEEDVEAVFWVLKSSYIKSVKVFESHQKAED